MEGVSLALIAVGAGLVMWVWLVYRARIADLDMTKTADRQEFGRALTVMIYGKCVCLVGVVLFIVGNVP